MFMNLSNDPFEKQYDKKADIKKEINIFKLNVNNYWIWTTMMKMNFNDRNFWKIISDDVKKSSLNKSINQWLWKQNNLTIKIYILAKIEKKQMQHTIKLSTAKKIMKLIKKKLFKSEQNAIYISDQQIKHL